MCIRAMVTGQYRSILLNDYPGPQVNNQLTETYHCKPLYKKRAPINTLQRGIRVFPGFPLGQRLSLTLSPGSPLSYSSPYGAP